MAKRRHVLHLTLQRRIAQTINKIAGSFIEPGCGWGGASGESTRSQLCCGGCTRIIPAAKLGAGNSLLNTKWKWSSLMHRCLPLICCVLSASPASAVFRPHRLFAILLSSCIFLTLQSSIARGGITLHHVANGQQIGVFRKQVTSGNAPSNAVGGGNLDSVLRAAADWWEARINFGSRVVNVNYGWGPYSGSSGDALGSTGWTSLTDYNVDMVFDNDKTSPFFVDPTPYWNNEFQETSQDNLTIDFSTYNGVKVIDEYRMKGGGDNADFR